MNSFLNEIAGNQKVKLVLANILRSKNIPHAFLFSGNEGLGKDNAAISFAKELTLINSNDELRNSKLVQFINHLSEPYIKYIFPLPRGKNETDQNGPLERLSQDEMDIVNSEFQVKSNNPYYKIRIPKANQIKVSSIRDIKKFLTLNYDDINYRIILISQAHLMNEESQNALLKNLEEPPNGVVFILTTSAPEKLRETIKSRCWNIAFQPIPEQELKKILVERFNIEEELADEVIPFSEGSVQTALSLIESNLFELLEKVIKILRYSFGKRYNSALAEFEEIVSESDLLKFNLIIRLILTWFNDLQRYRYNSNSKLYFKGYLDTFQKFHEKFPEANIQSVISKLDNISNYTRNNINLNVAVSNVIAQISLITS
ncbi:MAG: hypothetical protein ROY99_11285 [Ignavibacterium sp.]|jgi:DNA polymerase-3 subunit delta'|nr:hypothetical protein [Ignavibacterium sp.]